MDNKSLQETERRVLVKNLRNSFASEEALAEFLHQNYRAAAKSFKVPGPKHHDHGWCDCYGKARRYFMRRATWLMDPDGHFNGRLSR